MTAAWSPPLTEYARRYAVSAQEPWGSQGKSCLTPLEFSNARLSDAAIRDKQIVRHRQKKLLSGFETRELESSGCISKDQTKVGGLANGIHPLFQQDRWVQVTEPVKPGMPPHLDPSDLVIVAALRPVLKLASKLLSQSVLQLWIDGLLRGHRTPVMLSPAGSANEGGPALTQMFSFSTVRSELAAHDLRYQEMQLEKLAKRFHLRIYQTPDHGNSYAFTTLESDRKGMFTRSFLNLRPDFITLLCQPRMSTSQRLILEGFLALVLIHETCHSISKFADSEIRKKPQPAEPFFDNEPISEVGHSAINTILGGVPELTCRFPPAPLICACLSTWPSFEFFGDGQKLNPRRRSHEMFEVAARPRSYYSPMQIRWFESLHSEDYWAAVARSRGGFRPQQIIVRGFVKSDPSAGDSGSGGRRSYCPDRTLAGIDYDEWLRSDECPSIPPLPDGRREVQELREALEVDRLAREAREDSGAADELARWETVDRKRRKKSMKVPDKID